MLGEETSLLHYLTSLMLTKTNIYAAGGKSIPLKPVALRRYHLIFLGLSFPGWMVK